jgi:hydroxypyruvate reductase
MCTSDPIDDLLGTLRNDLSGIIGAGLDAVHPGRLVERALARSALAVDDCRLTLIAVGKAAPLMTAAALPLIRRRVISGLIVSNSPFDGPPELEAVVGGHPVPTADSERAGWRALSLAKTAAADTCVMVLLSGGASALMAVPAAGVSLEDKRLTTDLLLRAGADIGALNTVRKHISKIKGGLLAAESPATFHTFAISDVVGDDLGLIGSGPTVPDASSFQDALDIVRRFGDVERYPRAIVSRLIDGAAGRLQDTPKPSDPRFRCNAAVVIGGRHQAMDGAADEARRRGYEVLILEAPVVGEASIIAVNHVSNVVARTANRNGPLCVISSGETTVRVTGSGRGGRNQEFALAAAAVLSSNARPAALASVGTDGIDGDTPSAGAIVDTKTYDRARRKGMTPGEFLANNDSHTFLAALDELVETGVTGTNVGDLQILLLA